MNGIAENAGWNTLKTQDEDVEIAGKNDIDQRKSCKIHWKQSEDIVQEPSENEGDG